MSIRIEIPSLIHAISNRSAVLTAASGVVYYCNSTLVGTHDSYLVCIVFVYRQKIDSQSSQIGFFFCGSCLLEPPPSATCYLETFSNAGIVYEHIILILSMNMQAE